MISVQVEKEIKQENRIFGSFTLRQALTIGISGVIILVYYFITKADMSIIIPFAFIVGVGAYFFGFKQRDGLYYEYFIGKKIKSFVFMNDKRKYRTKNRYITMMNKAYTADKMEDLKDKRKKKCIEKKAKASSGKKTKFKAYQ